MSPKTSTLNVLLPVSIIILQITKETLAILPPHPLANLRYTPKDEYFNNCPANQLKSISYNAPLPPYGKSVNRLGNYLFPPPPPPSRPLGPIVEGPPPRFSPINFYEEPPYTDCQNDINDDECIDECIENNPKNLFKSRKGHFIDKRDVWNKQTKVFQKPAPQPLSFRPKHLLTPKGPFYPPVPRRQPLPPPPCNCNNLGYF